MNERPEILLRLRHELDASTFSATVGLMIEETRQAIEKQQALIALQRLARRNTTATFERLRWLEEKQDCLFAAQFSGIPDASAHACGTAVRWTERPAVALRRFKVA